MLKLVRHQRSSNWYIRGTINGKKVFETTQTSNREDAEVFLAHRQAALYRDEILFKNNKTLPTMPDEMRKYLAMLAQYTRNRGQKKSKEANVTSELVYTLYLEQSGRCALSGIEFNLERFGGDTSRHMAFAPSLDRIDNNLPYTMSNLRLVCRIVNFGLNIWGDHALVKMALGVSDAWKRSQLAIVTSRRRVDRSYSELAENHNVLISQEKKAITATLDGPSLGTQECLLD